jgi:NADPH-dependent ferric siderophore reductase
MTLPVQDALAVRRVRHPLKLRQLQVRRVEPLGARRVCITLAGDDLAGFVSEGFDDHIKVFFPAPGETLPRLPALGPDGSPLPGDATARPLARDYTPRRFDPQRGELDIEFELHGDGPASSWAAQAQAGQHLAIGGPRGSFIVPTAFDWHLLIGDGSALPAIARRLDELPAGRRALVVLDLADADGVELDSAAEIELHVVRRAAGDTGVDALLTVLRALELPPGEGYAWAAGELAQVQAARAHLLAERGLDKARIRAASYWKRGASASHTTLDD